VELGFDIYYGCNLANYRKEHDINNPLFIS